ncbi:hypothetical protein EKK58_02570 [Candidatus Dependentiae bacterium]|nr:MAG: hypothetical protein EKK58_02570 [Candidatus Dependentiae bacterium]
MLTKKLILFVLSPCFLMAIERRISLHQFPKIATIVHENRHKPHGLFINQYIELIPEKSLERLNIPQIKQQYIMLGVYLYFYAVSCADPCEKKRILLESKSVLKGTFNGATISIKDGPVPFLQAVEKACLWENSYNTMPWISNCIAYVFNFAKAIKSVCNKFI